ncbi:hypothetical protein ABZZ20_20575 [Streptomyces sp. NPDC006430]
MRARTETTPRTRPPSASNPGTELPLGDRPDLGRATVVALQ